ncbi:MAG: FAD-binding oxidoreductase [Haemophilus parainfluenzae]|nr:MAG: FAD-binding oxidoreductase [Haemophilus parainfluenzae]
MAKRIEFISQAVTELLGAEAVVPPGRSQERYLVDWRKRYYAEESCVVRPKNSDEVARLLTFAYQNNIPVTPQGGNTGLCGGSIPKDKNSIILSLERLNRVRAFSKYDATLTVEAGMTLNAVQENASHHGYYFPLSLASENLCQSHLESLYKNTAGMDCKQVWIGSEGTLGVITAATLKLFAPLPYKLTFLVGCADPEAALTLLFLLRQKYGEALSAFEYMNKTIVTWANKLQKQNFTLPHQAWVLVELSFNDEKSASLDTLSDFLQQERFEDAIIALNQEQRQQLWRLREGLSEAQRHYWGITIKHDIGVPIHALPAFIHAAEKALQASFDDVHTLLFGHFGDGSLHYDVALDRAKDEKVYNFEGPINGIVYKVVADFKGTVAAEHGVGQLKTKWLPWARSEAEIALMRQIKKNLDPKGIMNPGKVLPEEKRER